MSFLLRGAEGPTNIPEGRSGGLFQSILQSGLQAVQENNFRKKRFRGRMAGEVEGRRRSRLDEVRRGERKPKEREVNIMPVPPNDEVSTMPVPPDQPSIMPVPPDQPSIMPVPPNDGASTMPIPPRRPDPRAINTKEVCLFL